VLYGCSCVVLCSSGSGVGSAALPELRRASDTIENERHRADIDSAVLCNQLSLSPFAYHSLLQI
jgi:hypothetical protein